MVNDPREGKRSGLLDKDAARDRWRELKKEGFEPCRDPLLEENFDLDVEYRPPTYRGNMGWNLDWGNPPGPLKSD